MNDDRRLRAVHPSSTPVLIDPPCPDTLSDEWITGWEACREVLHAECAEWYQRGLNAQPVTSASPAVLMYGIGACSGFIFGFLVALAAFA